MKRIYFWLKAAIWVIIFAIVFIVFFVNRDSTVSFNYLLGETTINTSIFICIIFIIGAIFTLVVLALLNVPKLFSNIALKNNIKRLEQENSELKRKTHVL